MSTGLYSGVSGLALGTGLYKGAQGLWGGSSGLVSEFGASLNLDFLAGAPLDSRITFSRTTNATLVDSTGRVTYAPNNQVLYSEQFDNAYWTKANATVTADATAAPNGTTTADAIIENTATATHGVNGTIAVTAGVSYVLSVYAKQNGRSLLRIGSATTSKYAVFDLNAGVVQYVDAGVSASITSLGNGWYRCAATQTETTTGSTNFLFRMQSSTSEWPGTGQYTGNGTSGVFLWGAQLEAVTYQTLPSTYVQTVASAYYAPRFDYDPVTLAPRGLLIEEQRVNLLLYSEQFDNVLWIKGNTTVTANATTSPDGTVDADKLTENTANAVHDVSQVAVVLAASGATYSLSVFLKAAERSFAFVGFTGAAMNAPFVSVDLTTGVVTAVNGTVASSSSTAFGNGWWRVTITATTITTGNVTPGVRVSADGLWANRIYTGDGTSGLFLYGAQTELGAFATSYIPTVASTVTRAADNASMTGTNFSSWYNASEGTIVTNFGPFFRTTGNPGVVQIDDGTSSNTIRTYAGSVIVPVFEVASGGVNQAFLNTGGSINKDANTSIAGAYALNNFARSLNGLAPATDTSGTVPVVNRMLIGSGTAGVSYLNGYMRSITFYATRLTNAQLQAVTA